MTEAWYPTSEALLAGLRKGDSRAAREFVRRFTPILRESGLRLGLDEAGLGETIVTVLDDLMPRLSGPRAAPPTDLQAYVVVAFRNTLNEEARAAFRRGEDRETSLEGLGEAISAPGDPWSFDRDGSHGDSEEDASCVLRGIYQRVIGALPAAQRELVAYLLDRVPPRTVAGWLGIAHPAARVRLHRLRAQLRADILAAVSALPEHERLEVERILRRAGVAFPGDRSATGGAARKRPRPETAEGA